MRNGDVATNVDLDSLTYFYYPGTNQLAYVHDNVNSTNYTDDIDDQSAANYTYDAIGNMVGDANGDIRDIDWSVYGKIKYIDKASGDDISFSYAPEVVLLLSPASISKH